MVIYQTPIRDATGLARLLEIVEGRSRRGFKSWLADRPKTWPDGVAVVGMDGFTGFKTAAEGLPDVRTEMEPLTL